MHKNKDGYIIRLRLWSHVQVGAPPELAHILEKIRRESDQLSRRTVGSTCMGVDPELDEFMVVSFFLFRRCVVLYACVLLFDLISWSVLMCRKPTVVFCWSTNRIWQSRSTKQSPSWTAWRRSSTISPTPVFFQLPLNSIYFLWLFGGFFQWPRSGDS